MKYLITISLIIISVTSFSQVKIGADGAMHPTGNYPAVLMTETKAFALSYQTLAQRNAIPANFRDTGMLVLVRDSNAIYTLVGGTANGNWVQVVSGNSGSAGGLANFYLKDSSLSSNRTVNLNSNILNFQQSGVNILRIDPNDTTIFRGNLAWKTPVLGNANDSILSIDSVGNIHYITKSSLPFSNQFLTAGYGILGLNYNGSAPQTWAVDTSLIANKTYVNAVTGQDTVTWIVDSIRCDTTGALPDVAYLVCATPTGGFAGHKNQIATETGGIWNYMIPGNGDLLSDANPISYYQYDSVNALWKLINRAVIVGYANYGGVLVIGTSTKNNLRLGVNKGNAIVIDTNQRVSLSKYTGTRSGNYLFVDSTTGNIDTGFFKPLIAGTNITINSGNSGDTINSTGGGTTYTAGHGLVLQGTQFKIQDTLNGAATKLMWLFGKSAFRAGSVSGTQWDIDSTGTNSVAFNQNTKAIGAVSSAFGSGTVARGTQSFVGGFNSQTTSTATNGFSFGSANVVSSSDGTAFGASDTASALSTFSTGEFNRSDGVATSTLGWGLHARAFGSAVVGLFNDKKDVTGDSSVLVRTGRAFQIGVGRGTNSNDTSRLNAMTVYYNGLVQLNQYATSSYLSTLFNFYQNDTTNYKPIVMDTSGNVYRSNWFIGSSGQTTLVSGTKAITISGVTASSKAFVQLVSPSGGSLTIQYQAVCTTNTLTIQANVAAGTINTADGSTLNYFVIK